MAYVWAALGGALGALARWGVAAALPHSPGGWPWGTLLVNLTGCLLIGVLIGVLAARGRAPSWTHPFLAVGVLGGYTTFSTFAVETLQLAGQGAIGGAIGYLLVSVIGGVGLSAVGVLSVRRLGGRTW